MVLLDSCVLTFGEYGVALLGDMALLEKVCPCWRKCVTGGAGIEVSHFQVNAIMAHNHFLLPVDQDVEASTTCPIPWQSAHCHAFSQNNGLNL